MRIVNKLKNMDRRQKVRYGLMVLGILALASLIGFLAQAFGGSEFCGPLCPRMAIGFDFPRELASRTAGVTLLFIWLGGTFFFGRWICSHFCPAGALTEFGSKLLPRRAKVDYCRIVDAPLFRYGFLVAFILLPAFGIASMCCAYCNIRAIPQTFGAIFLPGSRAMFTTGISLASFIMFVMVLGIFARDGRGHCHLLCPIGALDSIANYIGAKLPFTRRTRIVPENCPGCGLCVKDCPTWAISIVEQEQGKKVAKIDYHRCNQCRICEAKCPVDAITYSLVPAE